MNRNAKAEQTSIETINAELGSFKSLASDPTALPSVKSTLAIGAVVFAVLVSRIGQ